MNPADAAAAVSHDVSLWGLFWAAHWVVKGVMLGLVSASIWVWAIIVEKIIVYRRTKTQMDRFEQVFWSGQSLEELYRSLSQRPTTAMAALFVAAMREWKRSVEGNIRAMGGIQLRVEKVMDVTISREMEQPEHPATVSSFYLDKYEVTVGRFRAFVAAFDAGWRPSVGEGANAAVESAQGLAPGATGWQSAWVQILALGWVSSGAVPP